MSPVLHLLTISKGHNQRFTQGTKKKGYGVSILNINQYMHEGQKKTKSLFVTINLCHMLLNDGHL